WKVAGGAQERGWIELQGRGRGTVKKGRRTAMGGVNAAIEVAKQQLVVQQGSQGEQFSEINEPRAIKRIAKRLGQAGCERVLIEGGSYQAVLIAGFASGGVAGGNRQSAPGARVRQEHRAAGQDRQDRCANIGALWRPYP